MLPLLKISVLAAMVGAGVTACSTKPQPARSHEVTIQQLAYSPDTLTVNVGDTVVWVNNDILPHTATDSAAGGWDTDTIAAGGAKRSIVMVAPGTADYICSLHPTMRGTIIVK